MTSGTTHEGSSSNSKTHRTTSLPVVGESNDIYTDPSISNSVLAHAAREDPLFRFITRSWRTIVVILLAGVAGWYGWTGFRSTREDSVRHAADIFSRARTEYEELLRLQSERATLEKEIMTLAASEAAAPGAKNASKEIASKGGKPEAKVAKDSATQANGLQLEEKKKRFDVLASEIPKAEERVQQSFASLQDSRPPYSELVPLYQTLVVRAGSHSARSAGQAAPERWEDASLDRRLLRELQWLSFARSKLDLPDQRGEGRAALESLANGARYVRGYAAIVLAQIAVSDEERAKARELLERVQSEQPDQSSLIEPELQRLRE